MSLLFSRPAQGAAAPLSVEAPVRELGSVCLSHPVFQKDDPDYCPIELSKVQSVKVVAKKRRDRSLPRAFEIFTDSKSYVFKAKDEKSTEEWLQCINVAVARAKERESREATTYL